MKLYLVTTWATVVRGGLGHKITEYVTAQQSGHTINTWKRAHEKRVHQFCRVEAIEA